MSDIKASILVTTYNWPAALDLVLANFAPQLAYHPDVELVIADDGSSKATQDIITKYKSIIKNLQHVWHEDIGYRRSMILNKAAAKARGEYLMFIDGDSIPFPDYIEQQLKLWEPGYFVAGNRVLLSQTFSQELFSQPSAVAAIFSWSIIDWLKAKLAKNVNKLTAGLRFGPTGKWRYSRSTNWKYPKGGNVSIARADFIAVNGFDEAFSGWGHEDADLFVRLLHHGIKIKDGRFAVPVLHLWHKNADRSQASENYSRLMERLKDKNFIQAQSGVQNYL